jgi:hypothetical protein
MRHPMWMRREHWFKVKPKRRAANKLARKNRKMNAKVGRFR